MPHFGTRSLERLETVDPDLVLIFREVIRLGDITIICGARSEADQRAAYEARPQRSKVLWPNSRHNCPNPGQLSRAVDWAPWGPGSTIQWEATDRFLYIAGLIWGIAEELEIEIRNGADWRRDGRAKGNRFEDLGHTELWEP